MKSRILTLVISILLAIALLPGVATADEGELVAADTLLTAQGYGVNLSSAAYSSGVNPYYSAGYSGECTWYAWGRAYEKLGVALPFTGNANDWTALAAGAGYATGTVARENSIMVEHYSGTGHVFFVESVSGGYAYVTEGNYAGSSYHEDSINLSTMRRTSWPTQPMGSVDYIYLVNDDHSGPSYSDFQIGEIGAEHFTAMAKVTDSGGVRNVRYAVWTEENGQDDLVWYDADYNGNNGNYWKWIPYSDHKNEKGKYIVDMYAYDNAGNLTTARIGYRFDAGNPVVENFHAWELKDDQFTVSANITSPNGIGSVRYAVWTEHNGQDDLVWKEASFETTGKFYYLYVPFSDHNNERGNYIIHLYAYDIGGKLTKSAISYIASAAVPSVDVDEGTYTIRSKLDASMCLDVAAHSTDDKANVWLWKWSSEQESGPSCEKFQVKSAGDGSYYIIATHSDKAVEVYGAYTNNGANISQFTQNQTAAQRWYFVKNDDGTYTIRNKATGQVMDVDKLQTTNGTNVQQYTYNSGDNQKFYLVPTDASKWGVSLPSATRTYTGKAWEPEPTVTAGGVPMVKGRDYTLNYKNNVNAGTATVVVTGKGGFTGSKGVQFQIASTQKSSGKSDARPVESSGVSGGRQAMHRLYNPNSGEHFYTSDDAERDGLVELGWRSEGEGWTAPASSDTPVYRMYNPVAGEHHYTPDAAERDMLVGAGWNDEGTGWYSDDAKTTPLYRDYNPNAFANNHNYTVDVTEHEFLVSLGWRDEGIAWYGL